jgi:tRNA (guanosine-2'-O-)-methyltransferase
MISSLNISVACAVSLYEAFRQKQLKGHYNQSSLTAEEYFLVSNQWGLSDEAH